MGEIIDRKRREIEANGWTLWSFTYRPMLNDWHGQLQTLTSGNVYVFCSEGRGAVDPVRDGSLSRSIECQKYRFIGEENWQPMPKGVRVPHPFQPRRKQQLASAFVVRQIQWPVSRFQRPVMEWLSQDGAWCQNKVPSRGVYLIRPGGTEAMRAISAVLELRFPYLAVCSTEEMVDASADESKLSPILVGVTGEYFVAGELSRRGLVAAITLRNSRGIDILVSKPGGMKSATIQVKTSLNSTDSWQLNKNDETPKGPNHYYVFVVLNGEGGHPEYHIVKGNIVTRCKGEHQEWLRRKKRDGSERKDTDRRVFQLRQGENFRDRWEDIDV